MCGRYTETATWEELASRFGVESGTNEELTPRYNIAPSQVVPIITANAKGRRLLMARWGFRHTGPSKLAPINARAETVAKTGMFAAAARHGRCLVPATGFYEWKAVPGQKWKQPYYVRLKGAGLFAFAGLWTPPLLTEPTCAIITVPANGLLAPIHDRMPAILDPADEALWLDPEATAPVKVLPCLHPFPPELMEAIPVSSLVSSPDNEGPELIAPFPCHPREEPDRCVGWPRLLAGRSLG